MTDSRPTSADETQSVVGHLWWSNYLEVAVHDSWVGRTFRVQFEQAVDGKLKHSGGGSYGTCEEERFDLAEETAAEWVREEFGYDILSKEGWSKTKPLRGMSHRDRQELAKLSESERRELAQRLRTGEIELSNTEGW